MKEKISKWWWNFIDKLTNIGIYIGMTVLGVITFIVGTSIIWVPTMLIIFAIKGII